MSGKFLLDTEVVVALLRGDAGVGRGVEAADEVFLSTVTVGELYYGALQSKRADENFRQVQDFARVATVLGVGSDTAVTYARLKNELRAKGRPIPENDLWIAATARQHDLTLVSSDLHFKQIDTLPVTSW